MACALILDAWLGGTRRMAPLLRRALIGAAICAWEPVVEVGWARNWASRVPIATTCWRSTAFSSDAIPIHLLTAEAAGLYWDLLAVHISNRFVELEPVVRALALQTGAQVTCFETDDFANLWPVLDLN